MHLSVCPSVPCSMALSSASCPRLTINSGRGLGVQGYELDVRDSAVPGPYLEQGLEPRPASPRSSLLPAGCLHRLPCPARARHPGSGCTFSDPPAPQLSRRGARKPGVGATPAALPLLLGADQPRTFQKHPSICATVQPGQVWQVQSGPSKRQGRGGQGRQRAGLNPHPPEQEQGKQVPESNN